MTTTSWHQTPVLVAQLIKEASTMFGRLRIAVKSLPPAMPGYGYVWFNPRTQAVFFNLGDSDESDLAKDWKDQLSKVKGVKSVDCEYEASPPKDKGPWLRVKAAYDLETILSPVAQAGGWKEGIPASLFGGPNPLSATIASGALGAGLGYGSGYVLESLFPDKYMDKGRLRKTLGLVGGALGAAPGLWQYSINARHGKGWLDPMGSTAKPDEVKISDSDALKSMNDTLSTLTGIVEDSILNRETEKLAADFDNSGGGAWVQNIEKDRFNRAVWDDPYTSLPLRGATSGLVEGASQLAGDSGWVSPMDIARLGVGMGSGLASGLVVGKTLGALAGISDSAQKSLQSAGVWAGLIKSVVPMMFGR